MYSKLAINNVRKSFKDYTIYFLTLTFAVCIFYSFNSINSQSAMITLGETKANYLQFLGNAMSYMSVFVSIILGGLIIYANNFLIKRRKKELGLYMSLGMGKGKMSKLLILEELIIGIGSLIVGLVLGLIVSQGLSVITIKLFGVNISQYKFVISPDAIIKTIIYFAVIFVIVMLFNTINISRYKLIDLLNAHKKSEKIRIKNPVIAGILFIVSLVAIGVAYKLVLKVGLDFTTTEFKVSIALGIIGTGLFFYGLTSFLIMVIQNNKNLYLRKLNIFTLRQMNSKVNTNFISMTVICLMLFLTISMLSTGVAFKKQNLDNMVKYDASVSLYEEYIEKDKSVSIENVLKKTDFKVVDGDKYAYVNVYDSKESLKDILYKYADENIKNMFDMGYEENLNIVPLSEINNLRAINGEKPLKLDENKFLIQLNYDAMNQTVDNFIKESGKIKIGNKYYTLQNDNVVKDTLATNTESPIKFNVIVPDNAVKGLKIDQSYLDINYGNNKEKSEAYYNKFFKDGHFGDNFLRLTTKQVTLEEMNASTVLVLYIGLYLGIIFLISSAAVLALQQLSEASDSADRYNSLRRIGAPERMINKSILIQTASYFILPLALGIVHSVVAIKVANQFISLYGKSNIISSAIITMAFIAIVYGGYFIATYFGYKNIVKKL